MRPGVSGTIDLKPILSFILLAAAVTSTTAIGLLVIWPALNSEAADLGTALITAVLISLEIALWGTMRDRDTADIKRMVKALYDHYDLGGNSGGRGGFCDKCGRGGGGDRGHGRHGNE